MLSVFLQIIDTQEGKSKFESLYYAYHKKMMKIAFDILRDEHYAEEAMQNALFRIAANIDKIKTDDEHLLQSYIFKITKNASIDIARKEKNLPITLNIEDFSYISSDDDICNELIENETIISLVNTIQRMPYLQRDVLVLYLIHELTVSEIAIVLNRNKSTIRSQINRGRKILKKILEDGDIK